MVLSHELGAGIPLLGTLSLFQALGVQGEAYFSRLQVSTPLVTLENGHMAVELLGLEGEFLDHSLQR